MAMTVEPLHVAVIGGHPLRFFRTPLNDGRPDLPWVAIDDLGRCLGLSRKDRRTHLRVFASLHKEIVRTIATPGGPTSIVPLSIANAAAAALVEDLGRGSAHARGEYQHAAGAACMKLPRGPFPSVEALTAWANAAANRWSNVGSVSVADLLPHLTVTTAEGDESRLIDEGEMLRLAMRTDANEGKIAAVQNEIVEIVRAWHRGELLPRSDAPLLSQIYEKGFASNDDDPPSAPAA
jgi:hypothetical protein